MITNESINGMTVRIISNAPDIKNWLWVGSFNSKSDDHIKALEEGRVFLVGASGRARHLTHPAQRTKSVSRCLAEVE